MPICELILAAALISLGAGAFLKKQIPLTRTQTLEGPFAYVVGAVLIVCGLALGTFSLIMFVAMRSRT